MSGIIDLHCDTILECCGEKEGLRNYIGHISLEKMKKGGAMAQCFAAFVTQKVENWLGDRTGDKDPYELFLRMSDFLAKQVAANSDLILPAYSAADIRENDRNGKMSAVLTVEDCVLLDGKIERVDVMAERGVCMASLLWNYENSVGFPNNKDAQKHMLGLKPFGIEAVERMNEKGIIVDVSHLSEGGFYDVLKYSKKPFAASHSCARALCDHSRNLTDEQLRKLGEAGGVVGVNFYSAFLTEGSNMSANERIVEHMVYMADKAGIEALALGSDFDGIDCELEMKDYSGYPTLLDALAKHFTAAQMDKIMSENFLRVMEDCDCGRSVVRSSCAERDASENYVNPTLKPAY